MGNDEDLDDDPFWEAVDLHHCQTGNLGRCDPAAITTKGGALMVTLSEKETRDPNYQGGMIISWNPFCFTGGCIEVAVTLSSPNGLLDCGPPSGGWVTSEGLGAVPAWREWCVSRSNRAESRAGLIYHLL